jgi:DNA-3-methyladenine glycosylase
MSNSEHMRKTLPISFFEGEQVVEIARNLLGKIIETRIDGIRTSGRIVETEAYVAMVDKASHAFGGRRTARNEAMYGKPGTAYVYICYGIHQMFNIVTNKQGVADAVLIRAVEPLDGIPRMLERTGKSKADFTLTKGPGNVGKALGIHKVHSGISLTGKAIRICYDDYVVEDALVGRSARIGVAYAGADAFMPYRFFIKGNRYVSGKTGN